MRQTDRQTEEWDEMSWEHVSYLQIRERSH